MCPAEPAGHHGPPLAPVTVALRGGDLQALSPLHLRKHSVVLLQLDSTELQSCAFSDPLPLVLSRASTFLSSEQR